MILHAAKLGAVLMALAWGSQAAIQNKGALLDKSPPAVRKAYESYVKDYQNAKRLQDFVRVYNTITAQEENFSAPLQAVWEKFWLASDTRQSGQAAPVRPDFDWVDGVFPGMVLGNEAEGTVMILRPSWKELSKLAQRTIDSTQDDRFTALMLKLHGDTWSGFPNWMEQTWDYGGCSRLGSGKHTTFLKEIQIQIKGGSAFKETLRTQESYLVRDLLEATELCHNKADALKELSQIEKGFSWSTQQKQAFKKQRQRINSGAVTVMGGN